MPSSSHPLVDVTDIIRIVGGAAFQRGQVYAKDGAVSSVAWDETGKILTGRVRGTAPSEYRTKLRLGLKGDGRFRPLENHCSCPVGSDCKHVAATALQSNTEHLLAREESRPAPAAPRPAAGWQASLTQLLDPAPDGAATPSATTTPLGLQFEVRTPEVAVQRWGSAADRQGLRTLNARLGVRPVSQNGKGKWVKNNLSWGSISYQTYGLTLDPDQHRWFSQFPALHRGTGVNYFGNNDSWLYLDDFSNPLLWHLLDEAERLGIEFVGSKKSVTVALGRRATLRLDATALADASVQLAPVLEIDGRIHPPETAHVISDHGVYTVAPDSTITLAPTSRKLSTSDLELLQRSRPVVIPQEETPLFLEEYYPQLSRSLKVASSDGSVELPEVQPPVLVLTAAYRPDGAVTLSWDVKYIFGAAVQRRPLRGAQAGAAPAGPDGYRDPDAEDVLEATARALMGQLPLRKTTLEDMQAIEFTETVLPRIEAESGIEVDIVGVQPDYEHLTETPQLIISTVETEDRDWFDLGVMVTVSGRKIPFDSIFRALAQGRKKLKLVDNSYLSLEQPVFDQLRDLIEEARGLTEWETGFQISRYQAGLWADFEDLADETEQAVSWRSAVAGLLELPDLAPVEVPAGVHAELRPYQREGFNWLAFLWRHQLGGVLADDMGLGKTLQALTLIAHARQADAPQRPFLIVAPTSVVPNWINETHRFTPDLTVVGITDTQGASGVRIPEQVRGADVVVTSYTLFRLDFEAYQDLEWAGLILDEAQFVKNRTSKVHQAAKDFTAPFKLAITGTPMENNLMELWSLFNIVAPGLFPSARRFTEDYRTPIEKIGDNRPLERLRRRIRPLMMRRTKEAVASDLPPKQEQVLEVELTPEHRHIYETYLQRERQKLLGLIEDMNSNRMIVFRSLTLLRMLSLDASLVDPEHEGVPSAKLELLFEQLEDVLAEGHRALVFSQFTSYLKKAAAQLDARGIEYAYLDGSTRSRGEVIDKFKDGKAPVFLISLKAGGFGLNLTEADYCFLLDPWWNPATEAQAVDRTHRIGQTKNVMVYRMVSKGTIEEKVMKLKEQKAKLFTSVMDDDAVFSSALTADDIRGLLEA